MGFTDQKMKYVIEGDASSALSAFNRLQGGIGSLSGGLGAMAGPAGVAAGAITAIGTAALGAITTLYGLAKSASDYGSVIFDATQKTGVGAVAISSLKVAADQSGASLEAVTSGIAKFAKTVGAAGEDAKKAAALVRDFGITPKAAIEDLDGALAKVFKRIYEARPGVEQMTLAQKAFGKAGADLIPVIKATSGDLEAFKKKCEELGIAIDDKAARAADEFGDQMDTLNLQLAGVGRTIGMAVMPAFLDMSSKMSDWLSSNQGEVQAWGTYVGNVLSGLVALWTDASDAVRRYAAESRALGQSPFDSGIPWLNAGFLPGLLNAAERRAEQIPSNYGPYSWEMSPPRPRSTGEAGGKGSGRIHRAPKESDAEFKKFFTDLGFHVNRTFGKAYNAGSPHPYGGAADIKTHQDGKPIKSVDQIFTLMVKSLEKGYRVFDERLKQPGVSQSGPHVHIENAKTALAKQSRFWDLGFGPDKMAYLQNLDKERLGKATGTGGFEKFNEKQVGEAKKVEDDFLEHAEKVFLEYLDEQQKASDERLEMRRVEAEQALEILEGELSRGEITEREHMEAVGALRIDMLQNEIGEVGELAGTHENIIRLEKLQLEIGTARLKNEREIGEALEKQNAEYREMIGGLKKANQRPGTLKKREIGQGEELRDASNEWLDGLPIDVLDQFANAIGSVVENLVLMGSAGEASMKKLTATILAGVAAQATVLAIKHLAFGIAALTPWGAVEYGPASKQFQAAALFASIAFGAGMAGRAVAGDSFSNSGSAGTHGSSSGSSGGGGGGTGNRSGEEQPFSRVSEGAFDSGNREMRGWVKMAENWGIQIPGRFGGSGQNRLAEAVEQLNSRLSSMRPGDVLVAGSRERRGFIGEQSVRDYRANAGTARQAASSMGIR